MSSLKQTKHGGMAARVEDARTSKDYVEVFVQREDVPYIYVSALECDDWSQVRLSITGTERLIALLTEAIENRRECEPAGKESVE